MKEFTYPFITSVITWALSHFYYRKKHKSDLEDALMNRLNDLSEKYVTINALYINLVDEVDALRLENKRLKNQITCLKKKGISKK